MKDEELLELFGLDESDRVERKESYNASADRIRQAICAHSNDLPDHREPGVVFVGQRDDLSCAGLTIDDDLLKKLAGIRAEGKILPFPTMSVRKVVLGRCEVAAIIVEPSENPPVRLDGRVWVRVGPSRAIATADEERRLVEKRRWGSLPYDSHGVKGATLDDIDLRRFQLEYLPSAVSPEVLVQNHRSQDDQLRALRFAHLDGTPTVAALLAVGIEPRRWIPGAYLQFLRVDGTELVDPIQDQREIGGTLADQLRQADEIVRANIRRATRVGSAVRDEEPDYPEDALRQLIRNAVLHRTYEGTAAPVRITWFSDRVEIQNPGGLYGQVTRKTFGAPGVADYRNPTVAEVLKALGFVERFGVGIAIARARLLANRNPPPEFTIEESHVLVTIRPRT